MAGLISLPKRKKRDCRRYIDREFNDGRIYRFIQAPIDLIDARVYRYHDNSLTFHFEGVDPFGGVIQGNRPITTFDRKLKPKIEREIPDLYSRPIPLDIVGFIDEKYIRRSRLWIRAVLRDNVYRDDSDLTHRNFNVFFDNKPVCQKRISRRR